MQERYTRNFDTISEVNQEELTNSKVCIIGCGGIGGYIIEMLGRIGVGYITAVDGDVFDESNLNRQILSDTFNLGLKKAIIAKERMEKINSLVQVKAVTERLTSLNAREILFGANVVVDALDSIETRLLLEEICEELNIPLVHGAIAGWYGQVTTIMPGDGTLSRLYKGKKLTGIEKKLGNPSFIPALVASIEASEVIKLLIGRGEVLSKKLLVANLLEQDFEVIDIL